MADGRSVPLSTKVSPAVAAAIEEVRGVLSRSSWLAKVAEEAALGTAPAEPAAPPRASKPDSQPAPAPEPQVIEDSQPVLEDPATPRAETCGHPRADWVNRGYGTFCGLCNTKVR